MSCVMPDLPANSWSCDLSISFFPDLSDMSLHEGESVVVLGGASPSSAKLSFIANMTK